MVQLSATGCNCIAILWVSLVSCVAITHCVASQLVFVVVNVYFVIDSVRKLLDTPSYDSDVWGFTRWNSITETFLYFKRKRNYLWLTLTMMSQKSYRFQKMYGTVEIRGTTWKVDGNSADEEICHLDGSGMLTVVYTTAYHWHLYWANWIQSRLSHGFFNTHFYYYPLIYGQSFHYFRLIFRIHFSLHHTCYISHPYKSWFNNSNNNNNNINNMCKVNIISSAVVSSFLDTYVVLRTIFSGISNISWAFK
jgi:hypothetical protein